jgi:hypothetical protein
MDANSAVRFVVVLVVLEKIAVTTDTSSMYNVTHKARVN